jgi:hypothetical protein
VYSDNHQFTKAGCEQKRIFLRDRSGNVIENKGPAWKTPERCRNVHENTGGSLLNPGMLMIRQGLTLNRTGKLDREGNAHSFNFLISDFCLLISAFGRLPFPFQGVVKG